MKELSEIETMIANCRLEEASAELETILGKSPDDAEARMLFGVCQQMMGRTEAFCEVYRDLAPSMSVRDASGEDSHVMTRWRHYCKVAAYLVAIGVITLAGTGSVELASDRMDKVVSSQTAEAKPSEMMTDVAQLKNLPRGVQNVKYDESGAISTLMVVGKKTVPKALRRNPERAAMHGGMAARREAQLEFTRFLSTKCKWGKTADGKTAVREVAASVTDAQDNETSAKSFVETEMSEGQKEQSAVASVSNIQVLWEGLNDSGEYVWVGAWNAKSMVEQEQKRMNMTRYNMGGGLLKPVAKPATKYAMGGRLLKVDDDF